jgi:hypothetical protein
MPIPEYPEFAPIALDMRDELYPALNMTPDGISEFTFSNLYLFRGTYGYRVSRFPGKTFIIEGAKQGKSFFYMPCDMPPPPILEELMNRNDYLKNLSESQAALHRIHLEAKGWIVSEDRDNFDYLYGRSDLATLEGKTYHKKRNLVNAFINSYNGEQRVLTPDLVGDAMKVLDEWMEAKGHRGDFAAASEALERFEYLGMRGSIFYVDGEPGAWCLGEPLARGRMFTIHFEKACDRFKGVYQFINQTFAQSLPNYFREINREQDLGDEGLRQAKMTYRPSGFVKKYRVTKASQHA